MGDPTSALPVRGNTYVTLGAILAAPFLVVLGTFSFNVALPTLQDTLHASNGELQLMLAGYTLAYAAFLITGGRLGDLYGRKKLFIGGMVSFGLSSLLLAFAPSCTVFIMLRILQGFSAAMMYPQTLSLIHVNFRGPARTFALSMFGVTLGLASILAQLVGGAIVQANFWGLSWRPLFLLNIPIIVLACFLAIRALPESRDKSPSSLDLGGVGLIILTLTTSVLPLIMGRELHWPFWSLMLLATSALLVGILLHYERRLTRRSGSPIIRLDLFRSSRFVLGLVATVLFYAGQISFFFVLTLYLQHGLGYSPFDAGFIFSPVAVGFFLASLLSPRVLSRLGNAVLVCGSGILTTSMLSVASLLFTHRGTAMWLVLPLFCIGVGFGLVIPLLIGCVLKGMPNDYVGSASGLLITTQQVAGSMGVAFIGIIVFGLSSGGASYESSSALALCCIASFFGIAGLMMQFLRVSMRSSRRPSLEGATTDFSDN